MKTQCHWQLPATTLLATLCAPHIAMGQTPDAASSDTMPQLEEVVVTAQHITEDLQRAAVSVTVAQGEELTTRGINDTAGLAKLVPGLTIAPANAYTTYNIRGITSGGVNAFSDTSVAVNYNQVSLAFPSSASGLYFDLERVELLNGPQGILYGRNATAGAVNVVARKPTFGETTGNAGVDFGNYGQLNARAAVNVPLTDSIAMRAAVQTVKHDGFYSDGSSDQDDIAGRLSFLARPSDDLSVLLIADYAKSDNKGLGTTLAVRCNTTTTDLCFLGSDRRTGLEQLQQYLLQGRPTSYTDNYFWGITGTLDWTTPVGTLTVIPAYRRVSAHTMANNNPTTSLLEWDDPEQKSLEVRLQSNEDLRVGYQMGLYALDAPVEGIGGSDTPSAKTWANSFYDVGTKSKAAFGQLTFNVSKEFRLVGGLRYTRDEKETHSLRYTLLNTFGSNPVLYYSPPPVGPGITLAFDMNEKRSWNSTTYKVGAEWDVADSSFLYADVRSGFKAGGFFFGPPGANSFDPEKLTAYSIGSKNRFLDNRLQANVEVFYYDYKGQQLTTTSQLANGQLVNVTENVGDSTIKGAQINIDWLPFQYTRLGAYVQYAQGDYDKLITTSPTGKTGTNATSACAVTQIQTTPTALFQFDCTGLGYVNLSKWSYNADVSQSIPLPNDSKLTAEVNLRYQASRNNSIRFTEGSITPASRFLDANVRYHHGSGKWDVTAFVNNLTNRYGEPNGTPNTGSGNRTIYFVTWPAPRTYGLRTNVYF